MRAWIFLRRGARDDWPRPHHDELGAWRSPQPGAPGVTVTAREDLAWWIDDELWETEAAGPVITAGNALFVARARLVRRVPAWGEPRWERFVTSCKDEALRVSEGSMRPDETRDLLSIARRVGRHRPALAAYIGALVAASTAAEDDVTTQQRRFAMARSIQSAWLARALCL